MIRRMSNRLAARAARASSSSPRTSVGSWPAPGPRKGCCCSDTARLLDEDDVQDDDQGQRAPGEEGRGAPPELVARIGVLLLLRVGPREAPHEPAQLLVGLGP